uniref:Right handed beta helix domain-containing protein n=1 Tax=Tetradesmus obliquus TaxID=3088 RepID=A0A383VG60_TETOB|eukprot:jgi/Sobl393_1/8445/SZX63386.1
MGNAAAFGGCLSAEGATAAITILGGEIVNNTAANGGGAAAARKAGRIIFSGSSIVSGNTATLGAGGYADQTSQLVLQDTIFRQNTASKEGGGVYVQNMAKVTLHSAAAVSNNSAAIQGGGVVGADNATISMAGLVDSNRAPTGGGIFLGGQAKLLLLPSSTVAHNAATGQGMGGGMWLDSSSFVPAAVVAATVNRGNTALYSASFGVLPTSFVLMSPAVVYGFVSELASDAGLLHADVNITGAFGLPCEGQLVSAQLIGSADAQQVFLGSNRSDSSGIAHLSMKLRQPQGWCTVQLMLVLQVLKLMCHFQVTQNLQGVQKPKPTEGDVECSETAGATPAAAAAAAAAATAEDDSKVEPAELLRPLVLFSQYLLIVSTLDVQWPDTTS